nr:FG-GAP repeat protein [Myxococcota bacterium]
RLAEAGWTRQEYGASLASGDFDGDGFTDLAIGVPSADSMGKIPSIGVDKLVVVRDTGSVFVHYGSSGGLSSQGYGFSQAGAVPGKAETNDRFGAALAAGDLDGNGADDLAIGVPGEDISYSCGGAQCVTTSFRDAGFVVVLKGVRGVRPLLAGREWNPPGRDGVEGGIGLRQDVPTRRGDNGGFVTASVAAYERFGTTLAIGDFNGDSRDDLAIGTPYEQVGAVRHAGTVTVLHGSPLGPLAPFTASARAVVFHQDMGAVADVAEPYDRFGFALAAGDFNGDGFSELAVGIRDEDLRSCSWDPRYGQRCSTVRNAGAVSVLRGTRWRLAGTNGGGLWHQDR